AVPDLHLGAGRVRRARVVEALVRLRVVVRVVGLVDEDLGRGVVAVPDLQLRAVRGAAARDVEALAERVQGAAHLHVRPLLGAGAVAAPDLHGRAVGGAGRAYVQAQAVGVDQRVAARWRGRRRRAAAGGVRGHVVDEHRYARGRRAGRAAP